MTYYDILFSFFIYVFLVGVPKLHMLLLNNILL